MAYRTGFSVLTGGLSAKLLVLTVFFVMLAEVSIYVPSIARFRKAYMEHALDAGHLAALALQAAPDAMVKAGLRHRLLVHAGVKSVSVVTEEGVMVLTPNNPPQPAEAFDLNMATIPDLIGDALMALFREGDRFIRVTGPSPKHPGAQVTVVIREAPMRADMWDYSWRIFFLSVSISLITATLVYLSLHLIVVRPMRRLTRSVSAFRRAPEDARHTLATSDRSDEIGIAERALSEMQTDLRRAFTQQARLAGVGTAVTKISHDLRGILTTAMLESDRLEATAGQDEEVRLITAGIVRALDRAVLLCTKTLRFAREGAPVVSLSHFDLHVLVDEVFGSLGNGVVWTNQVPDVFCVEADWNLMHRVLSNLCTNAREAGATEVAIKAEPEGQGASVTIADNGPGLPQTARENLFQAFAGSARKGGTGLGLPIARELMAAQGGEIMLMETGETGTVFQLILPRRSEKPEQ